MDANDADAPDSMYIGHVERGFDPLFHQFPFLFTQMATRALIGLQLADGSILSAYHHWDGYPEWLGVKLNEKFNTKKKVAELIDGGDMSACDGDNGRPEYYSERGEDTPPTLCVDLNEFLEAADCSYGCEYAYHFVNGEWTCHQLNYGPDRHMVREIPIPVAA